MHAKGSHANGTVACDGKLVFAAFLHADRIVVSALDRSGDIVWQTEAGPFRSRFGYAPSPILYRSCVIVAADHFGGGFLAALDRDTGKIVWRTQRPSIPTYSSPFIARVAGRDQLLISGCDEVASYDPDTGEANWSCPGTTQSTCGTMVANETSVFASGGHPGRETLCVRADGSGEVLWRNNTRLYEPSMLVFGGHLFAVTDDGIAYCWAVETGDVQWRQRLGGKFSASPVLCNGLLLVSNLSGETFVFQAAGDAYHQIAKNKLGDDYYASFALSDGLIFARAGFREGNGRQERLFCIGGARKVGEVFNGGIGFPTSPTSCCAGDAQICGVVYSPGGVDTCLFRSRFTGLPVTGLALRALAKPHIENARNGRLGACTAGPRRERGAGRCGERPSAVPTPAS